MESPCPRWNHSVIYLAVSGTHLCVLQNPLTLESVKQLIAEGDKAELQKCFGARMEFGTAGLRAAMGVGVSRMNDLTIIQTTQVPRVFVTQLFLTRTRCYKIN